MQYEKECEVVDKNKRFVGLKHFTSKKLQMKTKGLKKSVVL